MYLNFFFVQGEEALEELRNIEKMGAEDWLRVILMEHEETGEETEEPHHGSDDEVERVKAFGNDYLVSYNPSLNYVGVDRVIDDEPFV